MDTRAGKSGRLAELARVISLGYNRENGKNEDERSESGQFDVDLAGSLS